MELTAAERLLRHDRWIVGGGLFLVCLLSWIYLLAGSGTGMSISAMTSWQFPPPAAGGFGSGSWSAAYGIVMLLMWWIMMIAMMVPSAAPMILLYARVYRHGQQAGAGLAAVVPTAAFVAGYLLAWLLFSGFATGLHFALEHSGLVHRMTMWSTTAALSGTFLVGAGLYQFSPWKDRCLQHCRSPVSFLSTHWRKSRAGALRMGVDHGLYCIGCCWSLMLLLFVGGVMNLVWIAGLAAIVLLEKLHRYGRLFARAAGGLMLAAGAYLLLGLVIDDAPALATLEPGYARQVPGAH
jgi:predicted metal-binding membrane protein